MSQTTAVSAVKAFLKAWNNHNLDAVLAALDENVVAVISASPEPIRGKQGLRAQWDMLYKLCPDVHHEVQSMISQGQTVAYESIETAVFAPDSINKPYRTPVGVFVRVNDGGLIEEIHSYWDIAAQTQQLGFASVAEVREALK